VDGQDPPIHGQLGVLAVDPDGRRVQCHVCGRWFVFLAGHVAQAHGLPADRYRAQFGLMARTGLASPQLRDVRRRAADGVLRPWRERAGELGRSHTVEQRRARMRGRTVPLEAKIDPAHQRAAEEGRRRAAATRRAKIAAGEIQMPRGDPRAAGLKGLARRRQLLADPTYRANLSRKLSEARGGRVPARCIVCGADFRVPPSWPSSGQGKLCGERCIEAWRLGRRSGIAGQSFTETAERLRQLSDSDWGQVPEPVRLAARLYFGIADGTPWTQAQIAARLGRSRHAVQRLVRSATLTSLMRANGPEGRAESHPASSQREGEDAMRGARVF
jgi:hypothetical protein